MATAFLLHFQEPLREGTNEQAALELGLVQFPLAGTLLTVTEVSSEAPRRDPKKLSCGVFPN